MNIYKLDMNDLREYTRQQPKGITVSVKNEKQNIQINYISVGYGLKPFMVCPECKKNKTTLYFDEWVWRCADCCRNISINRYKGIQNTTRGGEAYIEYKMKRFAQRCGIGDFSFPFNYENHPKPKGKNNAKWERNLKIMQALENMRTRSIFYEYIWDSKTIRSVEQYHNRFLWLSLYDLKKYIYPFEREIIS